MTRLALDTSTLGALLRADGGVTARFVVTPPTRVAVPAITAYEIRQGLRRAGNPALERTFEGLLRVVTILEFDALAAEQAAEIRCALDEAGRHLALPDLLIAATARRHGCTLVTPAAEQERFAGVPGLLLESWG